MPLRRWTLCALGVLAAACGGGEQGRATRGGGRFARRRAGRAGRRERRRVGRDRRLGSIPSRRDAQALAESVLHDPANRDKTTTLRMTMTTIVGQTTTLAGAATALAAKATSVEERLTRLGAEVGATEITIRLPGSILFDFDSAELRADAERTLEELAQVLVAYAPRPARVEGHTDSIASDTYNQGLSERRAASVVRWLAAHGVAAGRLHSSGAGESRPVADNATPAGRQQNRRVEVIIAKVD